MSKIDCRQYLTQLFMIAIDNDNDERRKNKIHKRKKEKTFLLMHFMRTNNQY